MEKGPNWDHSRGRREQDAWDDHAAFMDGLVASGFLIIGGFRYITSAGNEETAEQAKKVIINAIIGVVVIILAFVIVRVISQALVNNNV